MGEDGELAAVPPHLPPDLNHHTPPSWTIPTPPAHQHHHTLMSAAACIVSRRHGAGAATAWARRGHQRVAGGDTSRAGARRADGSGPPPSPRCVRTVAWPAAGRQLQAAVADGASEWERGVCGGGGGGGRHVREVGDEFVVGVGDRPRGDHAYRQALRDVVLVKEWVGRWHGRGLWCIPKRSGPPRTTLHGRLTLRGDPQ